jgi:hypothetical protein
MKTKARQGRRRFQFKIMTYGNFYYVDQMAELETAVAKKPRTLQLELIGVGDIPADLALLMRSILMGRSAKTRLVTNARSGLQGASVLVWLLGDERIVRDDARFYFRPAATTEKKDDDEVWKDGETTSCDSEPTVDPEEADYAQVLQLINEFLPVKELAGKLIGVAELRQFGLVENEKVDHFLATALGKNESVVVIRR